MKKLTFLLLFVSHFLNAQSGIDTLLEQDTIDLSEIALLSNTIADSIELHFYDKIITDIRPKDEVNLPSGNTDTIRNQLTFEKCKFEFGLFYWYFKSNLNLFECYSRFNQFSINSCVFERDIWLRKFQTEYIYLSNNDLKGSTFIDVSEETARLRISTSNFEVGWRELRDFLNEEKDRFPGDTIDEFQSSPLIDYEQYKNDIVYPSLIISNKSESNEVKLWMEENNFTLSDPETSIKLQGKFSIIEIKDSKFNGIGLDLGNSKTSELIHITNNTGIGFLGLRKFSFPEFPNNITFHIDQLTDPKIFSTDSFLPDETPNLIPLTFTYRAQSDKELLNRQDFEELISSYSFLHEIYKSRSDIISRNIIYVKMKDLEGARLKSEYKLEGGFKNYFRWKLNSLLKIYVNHGTDPAQAIVISMYVILIFGVFYFFFPSEWDITSKSKLIKDFKDFTQKNDKGYVMPFLSMVLGFIISLINALTLSLNAFTTLGFGRIPTKGLAKYVCVIQGFIGWFLLSIFTVALINQVLA